MGASDLNGGEPEKFQIQGGPRPRGGLLQWLTLLEAFLGFGPVVVKFWNFSPPPCRPPFLYTEPKGN